MKQGNRMRLGPGAEFDLIRSIWGALGDTAVGGGDDCAIIDIDGARLALSVDVSLEGTHFRSGWLSRHEIGWRAGAAALSDLAAVAADPIGAVVSLGVNSEWPDEFSTEVMRGVGDVMASVGAVIWGGDTVRCERLFVDVTVMGRTDSAPVLRSGAVEGEGLWVTGMLGGPASAVRAWFSDREPEHHSRERFAHPKPRIEEAKWLREKGASAMIDLSDGLLADARHIAAASGVELEVDLEAVPVIHGIVDPILAVTGGEEYELLCTLPEDVEVGAEFENQFGIRATRIGTVREGKGLSLRRDGEPIKLSPEYQHL